MGPRVPVENEKIKSWPIRPKSGGRIRASEVGNLGPANAGPRGVPPRMASERPPLRPSKAGFGGIPDQGWEGGRLQADARRRPIRPAFVWQLTDYPTLIMRMFLPRLRWGWFLSTLHHRDVECSFACSIT